MKRNWILGICITAITGGAITLAQQEGSGTTPPPSPPGAAAGNTNPLQESPPVVFAAGAAPAAGSVIQEAAPGAAIAPATTTRSSSDPFGRGGATTTTTNSSDPFGQGAAKAGQGTTQEDAWDAVPEKSSRNGVRAGGSRFGAAAQGGNFGGFAPVRAGGQSRFGGAMNMVGGGNPSNRALSAEAKAHHDAEQKVTQLAVQLRSMSAESPNYGKAEDELKAAVKAAFEARQAMQKAEVKRLKDKLAEIESHVSRRESAKDVLIEERIFELKNGMTGGPDIGYPPPVPYPAPSAFSANGPFSGGGGAFFNSTAPALPPTQPGPSAAGPTAPSQLTPPTEPPAAGPAPTEPATPR